MSTGTVIIQDALKQIGAHSTNAPVSSDTLETARSILNSMLEMWTSKSIFIRTTPLSVVGDDLNEPIDTRNAIVYNLAIMVSPGFDNGKNIVSRGLQILADTTLEAITKLYQNVEIPELVISSTTPLGAGNDRGLRSRTFFPRGATIKN